MDILLLTWDYPPAKGGIQIWMFELARRLPDARVEVFAPKTPGGGRFDETSAIRVRRLGGGMLGPTLWLLRLSIAVLVRCVIRPPDLIVCGHVVTGMSGLVARRLFGIPYVVFAYAYEVRRRRQRRALQLVLKNADQVISISQFTTESLLRLDIPIERIHVLYPGVDTNRFSPEPLAVLNGRRTLLTVSRLNDLYKGVDTVIRALPLVRAKCPSVHYVIVGDGRLRGYLERLAAGLGVEDAVTFRGEVSDEELPDIYRSADLVVQLSREEVSGGGAEGFGIVCLEANAAGKAVVAGRSGGLVDAVEDGISGVLVAPSDVASAAEAIVTLLRDPAAADRLGQAGRDRVYRSFTWDVMAANARALFGQIVAKP